MGQNQGSWRFITGAAEQPEPKPGSSACFLPTEVGSGSLGFLCQRWLRGAGGAHIAIATGELLNTACRINELLLAGEERMTRGADTDLDVVPGRTRLVGGTAGADDRGFVIFGMKTGFHIAD